MSPFQKERRAFTHIATSGQSAARLDRWLISEQLRARVSKEPHAIGHVIGYPGDHLGVSLSLTAPASTLYGAAVWRLPLHLLDDQPFCDRIAEAVPAYLGAHLLGPDLTRGRRWDYLKRQVKDIALQRSWALAAQQRALLKVLEADSRAAMAAYSRDRQSRTELKALRAGAAPDSPRIVLDTPAGRDQGGDILRDYYSGDSATGLFAAHPVSEAAQAELLQAVDMFLPPEAAATAEGANGDGSMPAAELEAALRSLPRGKAPGMDGIPYEFYQRFWPTLGQELTDVLHEAFITEASPAFPPSLLQGRITLLYKGKGADRESPASYRPITLLNTDYKLAARTLASRLGPVLNHVVDATQTGFLPKRWVGDNVLAHLEEISYLQETQDPGVMVFLDFEKAFDRLDRAWIERCMAAVGFGPGAQRWVHILHSGTTARVAYNGWHTDAFPVMSGIFQGSPLSPLLFVLATQPMAAHARRLAQQHAFQPIRLPSGASAPVMHQHADDTSIHARSTTDAQGASVKHLGIPLSNEPADAATALFTAILQKVEARIARWSGFRLSLLGRAYVAKQVLASMVTYHATFIPVPEHLLARLCRAIHTFVAANRPVISGTQAPLFPGKAACFRAPKVGGIALVDIRSQISALQAKVIGRLLEPEQLAWKAFFDFWLYRSPAWISARGQAALDARHQHIWQLGRFLLFSTFDASRLQAPPRVCKYVESYQQLQPNRLIQPDSLSFHATMSEPLFFNRQLRDADSLPFAWEDWARQGLVRMSDLRSLVHGPTPHDASFRQRIQTLLAALPEPWHRLLRSEHPAAQWLASPDNTDRRVWSRSAAGHYTCTHTASTSGALIPVEAGAAHQQAIMPPTARPALVQGWDITRPWHPRSGASQRQQQQQQQEQEQEQDGQQGQQDQNLQFSAAGRNGPLRGYNRTLTVVEELEAIERMLPAEGEPLSSEKAHDVHEAIKKVLASLYKQLEFWKVADMKNFDVAEAWLKEQLGGHDSEWQKQLEVAEKWVERSKPKQQTKEKSAKFADREPSKPERPAYVRGRLRRAAAFWTRICHSSVVLAWIMQGYMIQWAAFPPQPFVADNLSGAVTHADWVSQQIWDLQCKGSVVPVSMVPTVVSPLNVVLRRGKPRLVLDLTYVNSFIDTSGLKFKYEQLNWASVVVQPNDFLFSVDLEAAYHHVEMHPSSWRYLGFCWEGQYYVFTVLPFGLNTACWVFTKLTRELVSHWRGQGIRSVHYLDDFLFAVPKDVDGGDTQFRAVQAKILADIKAAGFSLSEPKLKLDPSQALRSSPSDPPP
ncbi:g10360 [Coccomyxa elongata]